MFQDIFILGATGNVGKELIRQIIDLGDGDLKKHKNPTRIVGVASSNQYLFNINGITNSDAILFSKKSKAGDSFPSLLSLLEIILKKAKSNIIFIDLTAGGKELLDFHKAVIQTTSFSIVTANKNPLVLCDMNTFHELTKSPSRYGYRCSVMAGAEAVGKMLDLRDLEDLPIHILGCFSGTLGYLSTELEKGALPSVALTKAKNLGYTEPNPYVDLSGEDVARKIVILARSAGISCEYADVRCSPFISIPISKRKSFEEIIIFLKNIDKDIQKKFLLAKKEGKTLRYVAEYDSRKGIISVRLKKVPQFSSLGQLHGTANKIVVVTSTFGKENPYIVESPGAGLTITAQNIRRDLLSMLHERQVLQKE